MDKSHIPIDKTIVLDVLFKSSYIGILVADENRNAVLVNDKLCEMFAYSQDEIFQINPKLLHIDDGHYENFGKFAVKDALNNTPISMNYPFRKKDGTIFWAKVSADPIDDTNYVLWTLLDITENIETKERLELITERLNLALEGSRDGLWDWDLKTNEVYMSSRYKEILGFEEEELKNEFFSWETLVHPEDLVGCWNYIHQELKSPSECFELEFRMRHKNGNYIPILSRAKKVFDENKNLVRLVGTHIDLSKIRKMEDELSEQKYLLKTVIDETPYPIVLKNYDAKFVLVNKATAELYGCETTEEMAGKDDGDYIPDKEMAEFFRKNVREIMDSGKTQIVYEDSMDVKTNEVRNYMSIKKPFLNKSGEKMILVLASDITELNRKNDELAKKEKILQHQSKLAAMGEMLSNIAHQWRQPLNVITTYTSSLRATVEFDEELTKKDIIEYSESVNNQAQYLSKTLDDFRNFFKPDFASTEDVNLKESIEKVLDLVESSFKNKFITCIRKLENDILMNINENQFIQALINICNNSKDAMTAQEDEEHFFFVFLKKKDEMVKIVLRDSGGGIDDEIKDKIFEPYFTTKHPTVGTGLGLYMTHEIISKQLQGTIEVKNVEFEFQGKKLKGAEFIILLPIE